MLEMRALRMPRHLRFLPGRQLGVSIFQLLISLVTQLGGFGSNVDLAFVGGFLQFNDARFQSRDGLFEIQIYGHSCGLEVGWRRVNVRFAKGCRLLTNSTKRLASTWV